MKLLVYGINFAPELTGVGKYTGEMVAWLVAAGHEVRVVTAPPYYPAWQVAAGHSPYRYRRDRVSGADVWRCPLWVPPVTRLNGRRRLLHLVSFALSSAPVVLRHALWRPDVVWVVEPALVCAPVAWLTARLCRARAWLHVQDFEVDAAFELGMVSGARWRRCFEWLDRTVMRRFDVVSTISDRMQELLVRKGVESERTVLFANWVDLSCVSPESGPNAYRESLSIPVDACVALYSGNMGGKQGLDVLAAAAALMKDDPTVIFVFCGQGAGRAELVRLSAGLPNVRFLPLQPVERLSSLLGMADIHLLPQRAEAADLVMPSKLTGMLASGRPVVAMARHGSALDKVVRQCGRVVEAGNPLAMVQAIRTLASQPELRQALGQAGRQWAQGALDGARVLGAFEAKLHLLMDSRGLCTQRLKVATSLIAKETQTCSRIEKNVS